MPRLASSAPAASASAAVASALPSSTTTISHERWSLWRARVSAIRRSEGRTTLVLVVGRHEHTAGRGPALGHDVS